MVRRLSGLKGVVLKPTQGVEIEQISPGDGKTYAKPGGELPSSFHLVSGRIA